MLVIDANNVVVDLCVSKAGFDALADHELVAPPCSAQKPCPFCT